MPLSRRNTRYIHRNLYRGISQKILLLKRNDGQQEGTVTSYTIFRAVRSDLSKTGEQLEVDQTPSLTARWLLPNCELAALGILHINALDRIVDRFNRWWQPEAQSLIQVKLFENYNVLQCLRVDPYPNIVLPSQGVGG